MRNDISLLFQFGLKMTNWLRILISSSVELHVHIFACLPHGLFILFAHRILSIFFILILFQLHALQVTSPSMWLVFSLNGDVF